MKDESRPGSINRRSCTHRHVLLEHRQLCCFQSPENFTAPDIFYRGYRIVSDIQNVPGTHLWKANAAVVKPADVAGVERVHRIVTSAWYSSEDEAGDFVLSEAKEWIDTDCDL